MTRNATKSFDNLATNSKILYNYFGDPTKLFSDMYRIRQIFKYYNKIVLSMHRLTLLSKPMLFVPRGFNTNPHGQNGFVYVKI